MEEILAVIESGACAPHDAARIRDYIADAPFNSERRKLSKWARIGPSYVGRPHPVTGESVDDETELQSDEWHALKHCADGGWPEGTKLNEYLGDMRRALKHENASVCLGKHYERHQIRSKGASWLDSTAVGVIQHATTGPGRIIFTVYDVSRHVIMSCYIRDELDEFFFASWRPLRRLLP